MSERHATDRHLPSDLSQTLIVARYELFKHMRSKRLIGTVIIIFLVLALIYLLPPALGNPYTGTRTATLEVVEIPEEMGFYAGFHSLAFFSPRALVEGTLTITADGVALDEGDWIFVEIEDIFTGLLFVEDLTDSTVVASYDFKMGMISFGENFLTFAEILIIICAMFFGADAIVSEFQNRSAYLLFPNPVRKEALFAGKFLASFIASTAMISIYYLSVMVLSYATLGGTAKYFHVSFGFACLFILAALGLAYFISSFMKGSTGSLVLTFFLLLLIIPIIESVGSLSGAKPWFLLTFAAHALIYSLRIDNYPQDFSQDFGGITLYQYYPELGMSAVVMAIYAVLLAVVALLLFKRKELKG